MKKCRKCGEYQSNHYFIQKIETFVKSFCAEIKERFKTSAEFEIKGLGQVSGRQATPGGAFEMLYLLGKDEAMKRLDAAMAKL